MWRYRLILFLLTIPLGIYTLWQAIRYRNFCYLQERLGLFRAGLPSAHDIWIHAASIGEVNAVIPLIQHIEEQCRNISIILTTATPTGAKIARQKLSTRYSCHSLPIDWKYAVTRFLNSTQPSYALITETELWPNVFRICKDRKIPLTIINGRLSRRTLNARPWMKKLYADMLTSTQTILARSQADHDHFISLGANKGTTEVIGNLKFSPMPLTAITPIKFNRPYILAASTRDREEQMLARTWKKLDTKGRLLVIVPRHPDRMLQILKELKPLNVEIAVRSRNEPVLESTQVYIADTIGELTRFFTEAELVFMGGSLVPMGGQNIIEPAQAGKAVIFGPYMENFSDEAELLMKNGAALQVTDEDHLYSILCVLFESPDKISSMGKSGRNIIRENDDILERYLVALKKVCPVIQDKCK